MTQYILSDWPRLIAPQLHLHLVHKSWRISCYRQRVVC